tara:strand:+ start:31 stop:144 length:114 start_codon:yes stop_codon:yes gene_type:complete
MLRLMMSLSSNTIEGAIDSSALFLICSQAFIEFSRSF